MTDDGKLKHQVNLPGAVPRNNSSINTRHTPIMSKSGVKSYEEDKANTIAYINAVADLLKEHNRQIAPIVESYKRRTGQ